MSWMKFNCQIKHINSQFEDLAIPDREPPVFYWAERAIRTENIKHFEKITPKRVKLVLTDDSFLIVKYVYDELFDTLEYLDYQLQWLYSEEEPSTETTPTP